MRTDDIFEALTDIDDRFIEAARPLEQIEPGQPMIVTPAQRKPRWKTVVPAAACLAAVVTAGAVGGRYLYTRSHSAASETSASSIAFWYPEEAKYIVSEKITNNVSKLTWSFSTDGERYKRWDDESYYAKNFDELAAKSDLIVAGHFADLPHQIQDPEEVHVSTKGGVIITTDQEVIDNSPTTTLSPDESTFNYLEVERVLKGDAEVGEHLLINQETSINSNSHGYYIVFADDRLTPMIKGDEWIYFLQKTDEGCYIPVNGPQGRYPMPNNNNVNLSAEEDSGIDKFSTYRNAAPARDEIYEELLNRLNIMDKPELRRIVVPGESFNSFTVEEFPDVEFKVSRLGVTADDVDIFEMGDGQLENLILADLNGDGKRELCATIIENGVRRAVVRDFDSGVYYTLSGKREYFLAVEDNVLNVKERMQHSVNVSTTTTTPLALDMMLRTIPNRGDYLIPIDGEQTFCIEEFPDIPFRVSEDGITVDETDFGYVRHVIFGGVELEKLYLADISGDGKRELVASANCDGEPVTLIYDIENEENFTLSGNAGYTIKMENGVGLMITEVNKLLTFDMLQKADVMDYSKVSPDHSGMFTLPDFENFMFKVNKGSSFRIDYTYRGGMAIGHSTGGVYLCDLDGDGNREIVLNCYKIVEGEVEVESGVMVYDIMEDGSLGRAKYNEKDGGHIIEANGRLLLKSQSGVSELKYSKSDLKPTHVNVFSEESLDYDHTSTIDAYKISIKDRTLKIMYNEDTIFDSGYKLGELYSTFYVHNNEETPNYIAVFTNENDGKAGAVMISENSARRYSFEGTLKPTTDEFLIVHEDGTEEPIKFPEESLPGITVEYLK